LLPELESIIDNIFKKDREKDINPNFRLILSANPHPNFSISLLQRSIKVSQEPPKGIKAKMLKLYSQKKKFPEVEQDRLWRKAVYGLCWFHSILIERKKFKSLGWNVTYAFNDSDYTVCEDLLTIYMGKHVEGKVADDYDRKTPIPWVAIQYLIADANYGGRVTDDRDRRLIKVYASEIFNENLIQNERWRPYGTGDLNYSYPIDEANNRQPDQHLLFDPEYFYTLISAQMEDQDLPVAYG